MSFNTGKLVWWVIG